MGFKPIFEEEREFFKEKTSIELPKECWRNGSKIYLDFTQPKPLLQFKVENKNIIITKDNRNGYKDGKNIIQLPKQKSINELLEIYSTNINNLVDVSLNNIINCINKFPNHFYLLNHSGGKDSTVLYDLFIKALDLSKKMLNGL